MHCCQGRGSYGLWGLLATVSVGATMGKEREKLCWCLDVTCPPLHSHSRSPSAGRHLCAPPLD